MNEQELKEILRVLEVQGWKPQLCDVPVPFYDSPVRCGDPAESYENRTGDILLPKDMISMQPVFTVVAMGDSMVDAGIVQGDVLKVVCNNTAQDGDIVLASIDGETTVKIYYEDEDGLSWLVPQNSNYQPIALNGKSEVRIVGRIQEIIKKAPRVSYRVCEKIVRKAKALISQTKDISQAQVSRAIREIAPMVEVGRQWYAVCRVLEDVKVVAEGDFEDFCQRVRAEVPEHRCLPTRIELQRMAVQSFKKPVAMWNELNAPVQGKRFRDYMKIAERMQELLETDTQ